MTLPRILPVLGAALAILALPSPAGAARAAAAPTHAQAVVPFIADDLPRALAEAKKRDLPIFVESWAPW